MITAIQNISLLDQLLDNITPEEQHRTDNRMLLAVRIADVMQEKGISQTQLAQKLGKSHSVITKWLSGTQNFTIDTLSDIESALGITLFQFVEQQPIIINYVINLRQIVHKEPIKPEHLSDTDWNTSPSCFSIGKLIESAYLTVFEALSCSL